VRINQSQWDNPRGQFDPNSAAAMIIEESLELVGAANPRGTARLLIKDTPKSSVATVDQFDALLDSLYITIGELHKFGATPAAMVDGLQAVHNANLAKLGTKDSTGKVTKPDNFIGPEAKLQAIIDRFDS